MNLDFLKKEINIFWEAKIKIKYGSVGRRNRKKQKRSTIGVNFNFCNTHRNFLEIS